MVAQAVHERIGEAGRVTAPGPTPRLTPDDALFLDFDGTLSDLVDDPDAASAPEETWRDIGAIAAALSGAVAVISGRGLGDLAARTPPGLWRIGGHGLRVAPPGIAPEAETITPPDALLDALREAVRRGARLEVKGAIAALHYRGAPELEADCLAAARAAAAAAPGHLVMAGKMVVEVKPEAADKGRALTARMDAPPFRGRRPVMIGDDVTDEHGFDAALRLGGDAIKVGAGETRAPHRLADPEACRRWLGAEARRLGGD